VPRHPLCARREVCGVVVGCSSSSCLHPKPRRPVRVGVAHARAAVVGAECCFTYNAPRTSTSRRRPPSCHGAGEAVKCGRSPTAPCTRAEARRVGDADEPLEVRCRRFASQPALAGRKRPVSGDRGFSPSLGAAYCGRGGRRSRPLIYPHDESSGDRGGSRFSTNCRCLPGLM
jgi:hypothetical protein